jgi:hypothetical protein
MSRARIIKPGFFKNEELAELDPLARLLFAGLWTIADKAGRLEDRPKRIKAEILPYDDCDCDALLQGLDDRGFIERYQVEGGRYIQVVKWSQNQSPHIKETESIIPEPDEYGASMVQEPYSSGSNSPISNSNSNTISIAEEEEGTLTPEPPPAPLHPPPPVKKPTLAVDISKLPRPEGLSVLRALEGAVREIKGKPKLNAFDQGAINRFYAQHKGGLTEEMVEAAGLEMGEHTDGNALPYFLEVLRRMVEEPENNQPVKRNGGGTANGGERAISKPGGGGEPIPFGSARQPGEPRDAYDARRLREIAQRRGVGGVSQSG